MASISGKKMEALGSRAAISTHTNAQTKVGRKEKLKLLQTPHNAPRQTGLCITADSIGMLHRGNKKSFSCLSFSLKTNRKSGQRADSPNRAESILWKRLCGTLDEHQVSRQHDESAEGRQEDKLIGGRQYSIHRSGFCVYPVQMENTYCCCTVDPL